MKRQFKLDTRYVICTLLTSLVIMLVSGCAARASRMVPDKFELSKTMSGSVKVEESVGGRETNPLWTSQISSSAFTEALTESISKTGLFSTVIKEGDADYILNVTLLSYDQPWVGIDFDVKMNTKWELTNAKTLTPVWTDTFETTYRAKLGDALLASERLQKANEGSVRTNIAEGLKRLSQANF